MPVLFLCSLCGKCKTKVAWTRSRSQGRKQLDQEEVIQWRRKLVFIGGTMAESHVPEGGGCGREYPPPAVCENFEIWTWKDGLSFSLRVDNAQNHKKTSYFVSKGIALSRVMLGDHPPCPPPPGGWRDPRYLAKKAAVEGEPDNDPNWIPSIHEIMPDCILKLVRGLYPIQNIGLVMFANMWRHTQLCLRGWLAKQPWLNKLTITYIIMHCA